jgi:hypothetical protein
VLERDGRNFGKIENVTEFDRSVIDADMRQMIYGKVAERMRDDPDGHAKQERNRGSHDTMS